MEPITLSIIASALAILLARVAVPVFVATKESVVSIYRNSFEDHDIVILGGVQSGKTSLIQLLTTGKPYFLGSNGERIRPDRTQGAVFIGTRATGTLGVKKLTSHDRVQKDVGGEYIDLWKEIINDVDPHGIIYMIDGKGSDLDLQYAIDNIFYIIAPLYSSGLGVKRLRALDVFVNHSDQLEVNRQRAVLEFVTTSFSRRASNPNLRYLKGLNTLVSLTHLSPEAEDWPEAKQALEAFGMHIRSIN